MTALQHLPVGVKSLIALYFGNILLMPQGGLASRVKLASLLLPLLIPPASCALLGSISEKLERYPVQPVHLEPIGMVSGRPL